ncbi:VOC family protein [Streptomyces jumonjinensis]|uniref:VOC family protein n=1 Tax=Streptomyces jumonjinensis TaxID=1945 RepID=A0A646KI97_STRJU|nr:VOC family protein [Streptomyces jumonjinensis]MQT01791.1 VOC family protein [Streptomyces jumonjinensis]
MLTTRYVAGSPNWLDLGTPDIEAAQQFYGGLFGWTFRSAGPEAGGYGMFQLDGRTAAGAMTVPPEQGPSAWNVYFQSPDADATAEAVRRHGGTVLFEPMDVFDLGRMAVFADPAGVAFGIWQPGRNKGLDVAAATGSLCWLELHTSDQEAALAFYTEVFGWGVSSMPYPDGSGGVYTMVHPAGESPEAMFAGVVPAGDDPVSSAHWLPYFAVDDCDATAARTATLGGTVRMPPVDLKDVGRFAALADPAGARFAVLQGA